MKLYDTLQKLLQNHVEHCKIFQPINNNNTLSTSLNPSFLHIPVLPPPPLPFFGQKMKGRIIVPIRTYRNLTRHFSLAVHTSIIDVHHTALAQVSAIAHSYHLHAIHGERLIVCCLCLSFCLSPVFLSVFCLFSSTLHLHSDMHSIFHVDSAKGNTCCDFAK